MKRDAAMMTRALSGGLGFSMPSPKANVEDKAESAKFEAEKEVEAPNAGLYL